MCLAFKKHGALYPKTPPSSVSSTYISLLSILTQNYIYLEETDEGDVLGKVRHDPQLTLHIVNGEEDAALAGHESVSHLTEILTRQCPSIFRI
jgi:hypothetical protein